MVDRYRALPARRLVVLGGPGAGKTGLAALLALGLLARPRGADPVPYVVPVNSWDPAREHLRTWLVRRLAEDHYGGSPEVPYQLLRAGLVLPMLDGLDEVAEPARPAALAAIARAWADEAPLVVTCRGDEYEQAVAARGQALPRAAVVELEPVSAADALDYLRHSVTDQPRWRPLLEEIARQPDGPVAAALSSPLVVSLVRAVYAADATQPAELLDRARFPDRTAVEEHVFDAVIPTAYDPSPRPEPAGAGPTAGAGRPWSRDDAHRALTVLARRLTDATGGDLAWWEMHRAVPRPVVVGAYAVVAFLATAAALAWTGWEPPLLWSATVAAVLVGVAAGAGRAPAPVRAQLRLRGRGPLLGRRWAGGA
ncbi:MAG TPA: NACHT domain-containing protein, partial [Pilimelia sp.]|nr:NACHT domain-containing protein [Pilimelia sp.]